MGQMIHKGKVSRFELQESSKQSIPEILVGVTDKDGHTEFATMSLSGKQLQYAPNIRVQGEAVFADCVNKGWDEFSVKRCALAKSVDVSEVADTIDNGAYIGLPNASIVIRTSTDDDGDVRTDSTFLFPDETLVSNRALDATKRSSIFSKFAK